MAEISADIHGLSHHAGGGQEYRQDNPGAGLRYERMKDGRLLSALVGAYRNSYDRRSVYALAGLGWQLSDDFSAGVMAGAVSGYVGDPTPAVLSYLRAGVLTFSVAPPHGDGPATVAVSLTLKLGDVPDVF